VEAVITLLDEWRAVLAKVRAADAARDAEEDAD